MESLYLPFISFGVGLLVLGSSLGIAMIGSESIKAIARQPEYKNDIRVAMIIAAALIEGIALFGIVVIIILIMK